MESHEAGSIPLVVLNQVQDEGFSKGKTKKYRSIKDIAVFNNVVLARINSNLR